MATYEWEKGVTEVLEKLIDKISKLEDRVKELEDKYED